MQIVNIGCGASPTAGAINYDNSFSVRLAKRSALCALLRRCRLLSAEQAQYAAFCRAHDIRYGRCARIPLPDGSTDVVYSSHMLEHLSKAQAQAFLREARRVLKPEGVLRVSVPDMRLLAEQYIQRGDCDAFVESTLLAPAPSDTFAQRLRHLLFGHRGHHWMYDANSLTALLHANGFPSVSVLAAGETTIPFPTQIDLHERADESIYAECRRG